MEHSDAVHAIQSGVKLDMELGGRDTEPKHLRVGVNVAMSDHAGLARLLIEKGIITHDEYVTAITDEINREVKRYEDRLSKKAGGKVTLR